MIQSHAKSVRFPDGPESFHNENLHGLLVHKVLTILDTQCTNAKMLTMAEKTLVGVFIKH